MNLLSYFYPSSYMQPDNNKAAASKSYGAQGMAYLAGARKEDFDLEMAELANVTNKVFAKTMEPLIEQIVKNLESDEAEPDESWWGKAAHYANLNQSISDAKKTVVARGLKNFFNSRAGVTDKNFIKKMTEALSTVLGRHRKELEIAQQALIQVESEDDKKNAEHAIQEKATSLVKDVLGLFFPANDLGGKVLNIANWGLGIVQKVEKKVVEEIVECIKEDAAQKKSANAENQEVAASLTEIAKKQLKENKNEVLDLGLEFIIETLQLPKSDEIEALLKEELGEVLGLSLENKPSGQLLEKILATTMTNMLGQYTEAYPESSGSIKNVGNQLFNRHLESIIEKYNDCKPMLENTTKAYLDNPNGNTKKSLNEQATLLVSSWLKLFFPQQKLGLPFQLKSMEAKAWSKLESSLADQIVRVLTETHGELPNQEDAEVLHTFVHEKIEENKKTVIKDVADQLIKFVSDKKNEEQDQYIQGEISSLFDLLVNNKSATGDFLQKVGKGLIGKILEQHVKKNGTSLKEIKKGFLKKTLTSLTTIYTEHEERLKQKFEALRVADDEKLEAAQQEVRSLANAWLKVFLPEQNFGLPPSLKKVEMKAWSTLEDSFAEKLFKVLKENNQAKLKNQELAMPMNTFIHENAEANKKNVIDSVTEMLSDFISKEKSEERELYLRGEISDLFDLLINNKNNPSARILQEAGKGLIGNVVEQHIAKAKIDTDGQDVTLEQIKKGFFSKALSALATLYTEQQETLNQKFDALRLATPAKKEEAEKALQTFVRDSLKVIFPSQKLGFPSELKKVEEKAWSAIEDTLKTKLFKILQANPQDALKNQETADSINAFIHEQVKDNKELVVENVIELLTTFVVVKRKEYLQSEVASLFDLLTKNDNNAASRLIQVAGKGIIGNVLEQHIEQAKIQAKGKPISIEDVKKAFFTKTLNSFAALYAKHETSLNRKFEALKSPTKKKEEATVKEVRVLVNGWLKLFFPNQKLGLPSRLHAVEPKAWGALENSLVKNVFNVLNGCHQEQPKNQESAESINAFIHDKIQENKELMIGDVTELLIKFISTKKNAERDQYIENEVSSLFGLLVNNRDNNAGEYLEKIGKFLIGNVLQQHLVKNKGASLEEIKKGLLKKTFTELAGTYASHKENLSPKFDDLVKALEQKAQVEELLRCGRAVSPEEQHKKIEAADQAEKQAKNEVEKFANEWLKVIFPEGKLGLPKSLQVGEKFAWKKMKALLTEESYQFLLKDFQQRAQTNEKNQKLASSFNKVVDKQIKENKSDLLEIISELAVESLNKKNDPELKAYLKEEISEVFDLYTNEPESPASLFIKRILEASTSNILEKSLKRSSIEKVDVASQEALVEEVVDILIPFIKENRTKLVKVDEMYEEEVAKIAEQYTHINHKSSLPKEFTHFLSFQFNPNEKTLDPNTLPKECKTYLEKFYSEDEITRLHPKVAFFIKKHFKELQNIKNVNRTCLDFFQDKFELLATVDVMIHKQRTEALTDCFQVLSKELLKKKGIDSHVLHLPEMMLKKLNLEESLAKVLAQSFMQVFYPKGENYKVTTPLSEWFGETEETRKEPSARAKKFAKAVADYAERILMPEFVESGYVENELIVPDLKDKLKKMNPDDETLKRLVRVGINRFTRADLVKETLQSKAEEGVTKSLSKVFNAIETAEKENPNYLHDLVVKTLQEARKRMSDMKEEFNILSADGIHAEKLIENKEFLQTLAENALKLAGITEENLPSPHATRKLTWKKLTTKILPDLIKTTLNRKVKMELFERKYVEILKSICTSTPNNEEEKESTGDQTSHKIQEEIGGLLLEIMPAHGTSFIASLMKGSLSDMAISGTDKALKIGFIRQRLAGKLGALVSDTLKTLSISDLLEQGMDVVADSLNDEINGTAVEPPKVTDHEIKHWTKVVISQGMDQAIKAAGNFWNRLNKRIDKNLSSYLGFFGDGLVKIKHFIGFVVDFLVFKVVWTAASIIFAPVIDLIRHQWKRTKGHAGAYGVEMVNRVRPDGKAIGEQLKPEIETLIRRQFNPEPEKKKGFFDSLFGSKKEKNLKNPHAPLIDKICDALILPSVETFAHEEVKKSFVVDLKDKLRPEVEAINGNMSDPEVVNRINKVLNIIDTEIKKLAETTPSRIEEIAKDYGLRGADRAIKGLLAGNA